MPLARLSLCLHGSLRTGHHPYMDDVADDAVAADTSMGVMSSNLRSLQLPRRSLTIPINALSQN
eukprot:4559887-Prorocentrum_lima.AAC.1